MKLGAMEVIAINDRAQNPLPASSRRLHSATRRACRSSWCVLKNSTFPYTADLTLVPSLFAPSPDWAVAFDQDAEMDRQTRRRIFDTRVNDKTTMGGFHFPFPALGNIEASGNGYQFKPMA